MLVFSRVQLTGDELKLSPEEQIERAVDIAHDDASEEWSIDDDSPIAVLSVKDGLCTVIDADSTLILPHCASIAKLNAYLNKIIPDREECKRMYKDRLEKAKQTIADAEATQNHDALLTAGDLLKYARYWTYYSSVYPGKIDILNWDQTFQDDEYEEQEGPAEDVKPYQVRSALGSQGNTDLPPTHIVITNIRYCID